MDGLKQINDQHGHPAGDEALIAFGELLSTTAREADTVARVGGDEFAVLLAPLQWPAGLDAAIERFQSNLQRTLFVEGCEVTLRASVGGAV